MFKTLEETYLQYAEEAQAKGDSFTASYWRQRAFEARCLENY